MADFIWTGSARPKHSWLEINELADRKMVSHGSAPSYLGGVAVRPRATVAMFASIAYGDEHVDCE